MKINAYSPSFKIARNMKGLSFFSKISPSLVDVGGDVGRLKDNMETKRSKSYRERSRRVENLSRESSRERARVTI